MVVEVEITGMDEIERKLRALANPRLAKNAARRRGEIRFCVGSHFVGNGGFRPVFSQFHATDFV